MGKSLIIDINFDGDGFSSYYPGQFLTGRVKIETFEEIKTREIRLDLNGKAMVFWSDDKTDYSDEEPYFEHSISLMGSGASVMTLEPGVYDYPFTFKLPDNIPSTFEGSMGDVRYKAKVVIQRSLRFDSVKECCFKVVRPLNLNEEPLALGAPLSIQHQKSTAWCCTRGLIDVDLYANRACFVPGEAILLNGQVLNRTYQEIFETTIVLLQDTRFSVTHSDGRKFRSNSTLDEEVARVSRGRILPGQVDLWDNVQLKIPSIPESRLDGCKIISIAYFLQVRMRIGWRLTKIFFGKQLIVIGNVPLQPCAIVTPGDMMQSDEDRSSRQSENGSKWAESQMVAT